MGLAAVALAGALAHGASAGREERLARAGSVVVERVAPHLAVLALGGEGWVAIPRHELPAAVGEGDRLDAGLWPIRDAADVARERLVAIGPGPRANAPDDAW